MNVLDSITNKGPWAWKSTPKRDTLKYTLWHEGHPCAEVRVSPTAQMFRLLGSTLWHDVPEGVHVQSYVIDISAHCVYNNLTTLESDQYITERQNVEKGRPPDAP